jgi:hypothetical protein
VGEAVVVVCVLGGEVYGSGTVTFWGGTGMPRSAKAGVLVLYFVCTHVTFRLLG